MRSCFGVRFIGLLPSSGRAPKSGTPGHHPCPRLSRRQTTTCRLGQRTDARHLLDLTRQRQTDHHRGTRPLREHAPHPTRRPLRRLPPNQPPPFVRLVRRLERAARPQLDQRSVAHPDPSRSQASPDQPGRSSPDHQQCLGGFHPANLPGTASAVPTLVRDTIANQSPHGNPILHIWAKSPAARVQGLFGGSFPYLARRSRRPPRRTTRP